MKFLYFSDSHIRATTPKSRLDDYPSALWNKFQQISSLIFDLNIDAILINGDLFDTPDPTTSLINKYLSLFKYWDLPIYATIGSHDKFGYNNSTLIRSGMGTLIAAGIITIVDQTRIIKDVQLAGVSHSYDLDENSSNYTRKRLNENFMIQMNHGMILDKPFVSTHTLIQDVQTDADLCLCGHFHSGFGPIKIGNTTWLNVGSLGRTERTSRLYGPSVVFIDSVEKKFEIIALDVQRNDKIFIERQEVPQTFVDVTEFIESLKLQVDNFECGNLRDLIMTVGKEGKYSSEAINLALQYVENK